MNRPAFIITLAVIFILSAAGTVHAAVITPIDTETFLSVLTRAQNDAGGYDENIEPLFWPNRGPFSEGIQAEAATYLAAAEAYAFQDRLFEPYKIKAHGGAGGRAHGGVVYDPYCSGWGTYNSSSSLGITFQVEQFLAWTLTGWMKTDGYDDMGGIAFREDSVILFFEEIGPGESKTFNEIFLLWPGRTYELGASVVSEVHGYDYQWCTSRAEFDLTFVPEPATLSLLVLGGIGLLLRQRRK